MAAEREIPLQVLMRYFRVPTGDIAVDYPGRELMLGSRITNISVNGVFIRTQKPLQIGAELLIELRLPGSTSDIRAGTIVRWRATPAEAKKAPGGTSGMGLEFNKISRKDQKAIEKFVKDFLVKMRKG